MERKDFLQFGPFSADVRHKTLSRNGQPIPLPAKAFDVLYVLLQKSAQTVAKDELMRQVWPDTFVEEGNLTQMIFLLRKALGESDHGQPFIITVPRLGYRLLSDLTDKAAEELHTTESAAEPTPSASIAGQTGLKSLKWIGVAIALAAGLGGWVAARYLVRAPLAEARIVQFTIAPPVNASYRSGRVSPDGRMLALISVDAFANGRLWVRELDALAARPLANAEFYPFWSPDSRFIAFAQDAKLKKVAASGGVPQTICDAPLVIGGSWNRDGTILFGDGETVLRVPAKGGEAQQLTRLDSSREETAHNFPVFLPDGLHFLFTVHSGKRENSGIYLGSLDSPQARIRLLDDISNADYAPGTEPGSGYVLFVRGETLMAQGFTPGNLQLSGEALPVVEKISRHPANLSASFSASQDGVLLVTSTYLGDQVTWFDRAGKRLGTIGRPGLHLNPQLSPDEQTVSADEINAERFLSDIWLYPMVGESSSRLTLHGSFRSIWAPDSSRIAFESLSTALYTKTTAGTENEALLLEGANLPDDYRIPCEWSNNGRFLIYSQWSAKTGYDLWILPLAGNREPRSLQRAGYNEWCGTLSPNGKWIAYAADESGRSEIYVQSFVEEGVRSERKWQISYAGGHWPKWRRDGKELLYLDASRAIVGVDVTTGASFSHGTPQPLFASGIRTPEARFDVASDGRRFLVPTAVSGANNEPAIVILNWTKEIKAAWSNNQSARE